MPDAFFAATAKKRKRPSQRGSTSANKAARTSKHRGTGAKRPARLRTAARRDEELESDAGHSGGEDADLRASDVDPAASDGEEDARETPAEKRLRLAKVYLQSVKEGLTRGEGEFDAAEIDRDIISARLKDDVLESAGKLHVFIAASVEYNACGRARTLTPALQLALDGAPPARLRIKGRRLAATAALLSDDARRLYVAGKDGGVSAWDVASGRRLACVPKARPPSAGKGKGKGTAAVPAGDVGGHRDEVLALALSGDGKYLVSAGRDRTVGVWDVSGEGADTGEGTRGLVWVKGFSGHKDTISALSFRKSTNMLYSASSDRTIKLFDLSPGVMGYVETLFGHQAPVAGLDSLKGDTAVSCGGRDRTCRFWKIADETQLVFRGGGTGKAGVRDVLEGVLAEDGDGDGDGDRSRKAGKGQEERWVEGSVDCVAMVDEQTFVSGGDSGSIALWSINKKKPIFTHALAHGLDATDSSTEGPLRRPRWITSLGCMAYADLFASGSWDGHIRLWRLDAALRSFAPAGALPAPGLVNSLRLSAMPAGWARDAAWAAGGDARQPGAAQGVLLVAAVGQEHRLGRWISVRGGAVNSALVFALRKRTL